MQEERCPQPELLLSPRVWSNPGSAFADSEQFVEHEVALLDEQRFEEWLNLFADDGAYWVPANPRQESPFNHVSLFYDDKHTLTIRVQRLRILRFTAKFRARRLSGWSRTSSWRATMPIRRSIA